jgi:UDP-glucose 4-epimerase
MILITGGAGFIGSHLAQALCKSDRAVVIDDLSTGITENVLAGAALEQCDITDAKALAGVFAEHGADAVYHFAAAPEVRESAENPVKSYRTNVLGTFNVLEQCRLHDCKRFVLASTSTVYGEAQLPTPEDALIAPISNYGASKAACEAYACAYAHTYGIKATALRYANVFGPRSKHGVVHDFFQKLKKNPKELEILGDGNQNKSYLYIDDCISATLLAAEKQRGAFEAFNVGSERTHTVKEIASLVCGIMRVSPALRFTGGARGWLGDVPKMRLDVRKISALGWREKTRFEDGVREYIKWLETS